MFRAQLSLEIMIAMLISLLIVLVVLGYFANARQLILKTQATLAKISNAASSYQTKMLVR